MNKKAVMVKKVSLYLGSQQAYIQCAKWYSGKRGVYIHVYVGGLGYSNRGRQTKEFMNVHGSTYVHDSGTCTKHIRGLPKKVKVQTKEENRNVRGSVKNTFACTRTCVPLIFNYIYPQSLEGKNWYSLTKIPLEIVSLL